MRRKVVFDTFLNWKHLHSWTGSENLTSHNAVERASLLAPVEGFRLIDTLEMRIIKVPNSLKYLTLSYVWGQSTSNFRKMIQTEIATLETPDLESLGLLLTLSDAMHTCRKLGYRYTWIDCLCITTGSDHEQQQIEQMDKIYEGAELCLVAVAGSDADYGLPG